MDTIERGSPPARDVRSSPATVPPADATAPPRRSAVRAWLIHDIPYIAMLFLALVGIVFRLPVTYWVILTPIFAVISIAEGWNGVATRIGRLGLVIRLALDWAAVLLALFLLYDSGVQGVMNVNAISLATMTLLALGTFVAGVQAGVWQICTVGFALFVAVPALGWLDQSPLLLSTVVVLIILACGAAWWFTQRGSLPSR